MGSKHYEEAKRLLLKLHELDLIGKDQSPEADEIRDSMDLPERYLTPIEQERLNGLSGDLYMITGEEVKVPSKLSEAQLNANHTTQFRNQEWDNLLETLRQDTWTGKEELIACARALCWEALGDFNVQKMFAEHAVKLNPTVGAYRLFLMHAKLKLGEPVDSHELAAAAYEAGFFGSDIHEQKEAVRNHHFSPSELLLQTA